MLLGDRVVVTGQRKTFQLGRVPIPGASIAKRRVKDSMKILMNTVQTAINVQTEESSSSRALEF
jgi:hypothetical protein